MENWYAHPQYLPDEVKTLEQAEATYALREAWHRVYNEYPSDKSLAVLWAKSALETGRWKYIHCYNFGNIKKKRDPDDGQFFTMFRCGETINGKNEIFDPPHFQTHFRAYKTAADGAEDYLRFVSQKARYKKAWQKVLEGDPKGYAHELKVAGYYTANEAQYTAGVVRLFDEFMKRKEELMSWKPEERDTDPAPPPDTDPAPPPPDTETELSPVTISSPLHEADTEIENEVPSKPLVSVDTNQSNEVQPQNNFGSIILIAFAGFSAIIAWLLSLFNL